MLGEFESSCGITQPSLKGQWEKADGRRDTNTTQPLRENWMLLLTPPSVSLHPEMMSPLFWVIYIAGLTCPGRWFFYTCLDPKYGSFWRGVAIGISSLSSNVSAPLPTGTGFKQNPGVSRYLGCGQDVSVVGTAFIPPDDLDMWPRISSTALPLYRFSIRIISMFILPSFLTFLVQFYFPGPSCFVFHELSKPWPPIP